MRYGFKAEAERVSAGARQLLGLNAADPIDPWAYATARNVVVLEMASLNLEPRHREQLLVKDNESWSGLTLKMDNSFFVVVNPSHPISRQRNTLMHEMAHIHLGHTPARVDFSNSGMMLLSDYPIDQEDEANWLAAAILIPREALYSLRRLGKGVEEIASIFGVSKQLSEWRLRMTGVDSQLKRAARLRSGSMGY
jgi:Zn-dependent peptidase ImmA (M78 family)